MIWKPNVTVAAVVERDGRFLLVEETADGRLVLNQPAGHLDEGESLIEAVVRETLEETAWHFRPEALVGIYRWPHPGRPVTYLRFAFAGRVVDHEPARRLDEGIAQAVWLTPEELRAASDRHRSPLVQRCVDDFLEGRRFPLGLLADLAGGTP
ncbi:7,8-dihydro-8-oxoguanine-triphosphatase [Sulfurifustis variabilis]|uniref:Phosphatase NudJ n=1 Tax=Sulfurifustis variabilis TaxID=1675686 RepID=A0A1B4VDZ8_9GAMM|nr:NUDIX hydrolase [Sulfurifustis variabilis]BAU48807.1 7,8-dihydro-8-oxoguanine-triphosphatase [Sulfurifustis variabilis]